MMVQPMLSMFEVREPEPRRSIPTRALYAGVEPVQVLDYSGNGKFFVVRGERTTTIDRRFLTFLKDRR